MSKKVKANSENTEPRLIAHFFIDGAVVVRDGEREITETDIVYHYSDPRSEYTEAIMTDDGILWASNNHKVFVIALAIYMNGQMVNYQKLLDALGLKDRAEQLREMSERVAKFEKRRRYEGKQGSTGAAEQGPVDD